MLWHCYLEIDCGVSAKKSVMVINILQMICIGHVLEASGLYYQQTLLKKLEWKTTQEGFIMIPLEWEVTF